MYFFNQEDINSYDYIAKNNKYNLAFTNYNTAISTWNKLNNDLFNVKRPSRPSLIVSNLEDSISNSFNYNKKYKFLLVPSQESYNFTKQYQLRNKMNLVYSTISNHISSIELWSKRILWSLTSRQP